MFVTVLSKGKLESSVAATDDVEVCAVKGGMWVCGLRVHVWGLAKGSCQGVSSHFRLMIYCKVENPQLW